MNQQNHDSQLARRINAAHIAAVMGLVVLCLPLKHLLLKAQRDSSFNLIPSVSHQFIIPVFLVSICCLLVGGLFQKYRFLYPIYLVGMISLLYPSKIMTPNWFMEINVALLALVWGFKSHDKLMLSPEILRTDSSRARAANQALNSLALVILSGVFWRGVQTLLGGELRVTKLEVGLASTMVLLSLLSFIPRLRTPASVGIVAAIAISLVPNFSLSANSIRDLIVLICVSTLVICGLANRTDISTRTLILNRGFLHFLILALGWLLPLGSALGILVFKLL